MRNIPFSSPKQQKQAINFSLRGRIFGWITNVIIGIIVLVIIHQKSLSDENITPGYPEVTLTLFIILGIVVGCTISHLNFYVLKLSLFTRRLSEKDIRTWVNFRKRQIQENINQVDAQIADAEDGLLKLKDRRDLLIQKETEGDKILESLLPTQHVDLQKV